MQHFLFGSSVEMSLREPGLSCDEQNQYLPSDAVLFPWKPVQYDALFWTHLRIADLGQNFNVTKASKGMFCKDVLEPFGNFSFSFK